MLTLQALKFYLFGVKTRQLFSALTKLSGLRVVFGHIAAPQEQVWTLHHTPDRYPICQFWHQRVLGTPHTTRKPLLLLLRLEGLLLLRYAERQFLGLLFQEPPRLAAYPVHQNSKSQVGWAPPTIPNPNAPPTIPNPIKRWAVPTS